MLIFRRNKVKLYLWLLFCAVVIVGCESKPQTISFKEISRNFKQNRDVYEKIVDIFIRNNNLRRLEVSDLGSGKFLRCNIDKLGPVDKDVLVSEMANQLGVNLISVVSFNSWEQREVNEISFYKYRDGIISSGGILLGISYFIHQEPKTLNSSVERYLTENGVPEKGKIDRVYSKLDNKWYLFFERQ